MIKLTTLLQEEHEAILKKREDSSSGITWEEYKSMTFTTQVSQLMHACLP
jgi:hypothetical protein